MVVVVLIGDVRDEMDSVIDSGGDVVSALLGSCWLRECILIPEGDFGDLEDGDL